MHHRSTRIYWLKALGICWEYLHTHSHRAMENSKTYQNYEAEDCKPRLKQYRKSQSFGWKFYHTRFNAQNNQFVIVGPQKDCSCIVKVQSMAGRSWKATFSHSQYFSKQDHPETVSPLKKKNRGLAKGWHWRTLAFSVELWSTLMCIAALIGL